MGKTAKFIRSYFDNKTFKKSMEVRRIFGRLKILHWQCHRYPELQKEIQDLMDECIKLYPYK